MTLNIQADMPPIQEDEYGVVRVGNTRVPLERVVEGFLAGMTPEQIAQDFDVLRIEDIYAVIGYYLRHRDEVDAYLAKADCEAAKTRELMEKQFDPTGIRARLLARRRPEAS
jgi:uncharacterized protein (DUF433 family)